MLDGGSRVSEVGRRKTEIGCRMSGVKTSSPAPFKGGVVLHDFL